jgi:hypothetical protein
MFLLNPHPVTRDMLTLMSSPTVLPTNLLPATTASVESSLLSSLRLRPVLGSRRTLRCCSRTRTLLWLRDIVESTGKQYEIYVVDQLCYLCCMAIAEMRLAGLSLYIF